MMEIESLLKEAFDMNSYEAKVYIALLPGAMNPKEVASSSRVPMPRVYDTLRGLTEKGFVQYLGGSYHSVRPEVALEAQIARYTSDFAERQAAREDARKRIVGQLSPLYKGESGMKRPVLMSGMESIGGAFLDIIATSHDIIFLVRKAMKAKSKFISYLGAVSTSGKRIRVLIPAGVTLTDSDREFAKASGMEIRKCENPIVDMMVADVRDVVLGVPETEGDEPFSAVAVWVRNGSFARSTREALEEIWKSAKP